MLSPSINSVSNTVDPHTKVPPSAIPRNTLVTMRPEYDVTNAVPIETAPKLVIRNANHIEPIRLSARLEGISTTMSYTCHTHWGRQRMSNDLDRIMMRTKI
jgi:hypothetical protein